MFICHSRPDLEFELLPEDEERIHDGFKCYEEGVDDPVHHPLDIPGMDFL